MPAGSALARMSGLVVTSLLTMKCSHSRFPDGLLLVYVTLSGAISL